MILDKRPWLFESKSILKYKCYYKNRELVFFGNLLVINSNMRDCNLVINNHLIIFSTMIKYPIN